MAITKQTIWKFKIVARKKKSIFKDDQEALRVFGAGVMNSKSFTLMHVKKRDGTGFGNVGAAKKALIHFGVKLLLIACFHIVEGGKNINIVFSNNEKHLKALFQVFNKLDFNVIETRISEGDKISSEEFMNGAKAIYKRFSKVMERNAAQKQFVLQWKRLCEEEKALVKKNLLRIIYYNEIMEDGSYRVGAKERGT